VIVQPVRHYGPQPESWLSTRQGRETAHAPRHTNVRARSAKVGSGTGIWSLDDPVPACFLPDEVVIRGLLS
jgi:hypothetical protein